MLSKALIHTAFALSTATGSLAALSAGCGKSPSLQSGNQPNIQVAGQSRQWILRIPSNYNPNTPYRLIFGLHWLNGNYENVDSGQYYGLQPLANNQAIFVAPNGLNNGWANNNGNDITFLEDLITLIENDLCVDTNLLHSVGWSYGGAMTYSLACSLGSSIRAVAVLSGALLSGCAGGTQPVAYYGQHGVSDAVLPFADGESLRDHWVQANGCQNVAAPAPQAGSGTHIKTVYPGCSSGHPVTWIAFDGPHEPEASDRGGSEWTSGEVWEFFSQFNSSSSTGPSSSSRASTPTTSHAPTTSPASSTTLVTTTSSAPTGGCTASEWAQCGGINYSGCTQCASGLTCKAQNPYYSQCLSS